MEINVDKLSLEQCKKIREELGYKEESIYEQLIDENYFFMKSSHRAVIAGQLKTKQDVAILIECMANQSSLDELHFQQAYVEASQKINGVKESQVLTRDLLYLYNEAIPMEYKNNIFSYKRNHKKADSIDENVRKMIYGLTEKVKGKRVK